MCKDHIQIYEQWLFKCDDTWMENITLFPLIHSVFKSITVNIGLSAAFLLMQLLCRLI